MNKRVCEVGARVLGTATLVPMILGAAALFLGVAFGAIIGTAWLGNALLGITKAQFDWFMPFVVLPIVGVTMCVGLVLVGYEQARMTGWVGWYRRHCEEFWERGQ